MALRNAKATLPVASSRGGRWSPFHPPIQRSQEIDRPIRSPRSTACSLSIAALPSAAPSTGSVAPAATLMLLRVPPAPQEDREWKCDRLLHDAKSATMNRYHCPRSQLAPKRSQCILRTVRPPHSIVRTAMHMHPRRDELSQLQTTTATTRRARVAMRRVTESVLEGRGGSHGSVLQCCIGSLREGCLFTRPVDTRLHRRSILRARDSGVRCVHHLGDGVRIRVALFSAKCIARPSSKRLENHSKHPK